MKKQYFIFASILMLSIFLIFHTTVILLKVMPLNPISVKARPFTDSYGMSLFNQNWHLFAPTPIMTNNHIYMQVSLKDKQTDWLDISTEIKKINHEKFITPYNRIVRLVDGIVMELQGNIQDDLYFKYLTKTSEESNFEILDENIQQAEENLYRYASAYAKYLYTENEVKMIRIKVISYEVVPFSERNNTTYEPGISYEELYDWQPLNKDVNSF